MEKALGITAEYNPFHNGHARLLAEAKKLVGDLPVIAVMSGSLMQRGEPAFADKWLRAQMALAGGVDLVLELPTIFCCRSAEHFAAGAVQSLAACGVTGYLACGAETATASDLFAAAAVLARASAQAALQEHIKSGSSYAAASARVLQTEGCALTCEQPNDILALEYAKALRKYQLPQQLIVIKRNGDAYNANAITTKATSAGALRRSYHECGLSTQFAAAVPQPVFAFLQKANTAQRLGYDRQLLTNLILYKLQSMSAEQIFTACQCTEGLENRLKQAAAATDLRNIIGSAVNKRYPASRVRRLLMQLLLNQNKQSFTATEPTYLRVLGFTDRGRALLGNMRERAALPLITKLGRLKPTANPLTTQLSVDIAATNLLALLQHNAKGYNADYLTAPIYQKGT